MIVAILKKISSKISYNLFTKTTLIGVAILIILNFTFIASYNYNSAEMHKDAVRKILNVCYMLDNTPFSAQTDAINAIKDPSLSVSITTQPAWSLHFFKVDTVWKTYKKFSTTKDERFITLSYKLDNEKWLNIKVDSRYKFSHSMILLIAIEIAAILVIILYAGLLQRFAKPLKSIKKIAGELTLEQPLQQKLLSKSNVINQIDATFSKLQTKLNDLVKERTLILAALSHDLRTPITRLQFRSQMINDPAMLEQITDILQRMENIIRKTLFIAKFNYQDAVPEKIDISSLLSDIITNLNNLNTKINYQNKTPAKILSINPAALKYALTDLLRNIADNENLVTVDLQKNKNKIIISISGNINLDQLDTDIIKSVMTLQKGRVNISNTKNPTMELVFNHNQ